MKLQSFYLKKLLNCLNLEVFSKNFCLDEIWKLFLRKAYFLPKLESFYLKSSYHVKTSVSFFKKVYCRNWKAFNSESSCIVRLESFYFKKLCSCRNLQAFISNSSCLVEMSNPFSLEKLLNCRNFKVFISKIRIQCRASTRFINWYKNADKLLNRTKIHSPAHKKYPTT